MSSTRADVSALFRSSDSDHGSLVRWDEAKAKGRAGATTSSSPVQGRARTQARHEGPSALRRVLQKDSVWGYEDQIGFGVRHGCAG